MQTLTPLDHAILIDLYLLHQMSASLTARWSVLLVDGLAVVRPGSQPLFKKVVGSGKKWLVWFGLAGLAKELVYIGL